MDVATGGGSGRGGETGGPSAEAIDSIGDGAGGSSGGGAATSPSMAPVTNSGGPIRERRVASISQSSLQHRHRFHD